MFDRKAKQIIAALGLAVEDVDGGHDLGLPRKRVRALTKFEKRTTRGENNAQAKLTEKDVRIIRVRLAANETQRLIAAEFGVSRATIGLVGQRKFWSHI